jgi:hypothetical protein
MVEVARSTSFTSFFRDWKLFMLHFMSISWWQLHMLDCDASSSLCEKKLVYASVPTILPQAGKNSRRGSLLLAVAPRPCACLQATSLAFTVIECLREQDSGGKVGQLLQTLEQYWVEGKFALLQSLCCE